MKRVISLSLDADLIVLIDRVRGGVPRSAYVEDLLIRASPSMPQVVDLDGRDPAASEPEAKAPERLADPEVRGAGATPASPAQLLYCPVHGCSFAARSPGATCPHHGRKVSVPSSDLHPG